MPPDGHNRVLYRRIRPEFWNERHVSIHDTAFQLRPGESGLSLYDSMVVEKPRNVIQAQVDLWKNQLNRDHEDTRRYATKKLKQYGSTVEELIDNGWGVAEIPFQSFQIPGFTISEAEPDGHVNVCSTRELFETYALDFMLAARICTRQECAD
ncbi:MAG: hypothetical protein ACLQVD_18185 [Capsulimonadaceae bacterium]